MVNSDLGTCPAAFAVDGGLFAGLWGGGGVAVGRTGMFYLCIDLPCRPSAGPSQPAAPPGPAGARDAGLGRGCKAASRPVGEGMGSPVSLCERCR